MNYTKFFILIFILLQFSCEKDETLSSFYQNNKKIEDSNENKNIKNELFLESIFIQAEKDDAYIPYKTDAKRFHAIGDGLFKYIEDLKLVIKEKNSTDYVDELFFNTGEITTEGNEFLLYVENYKRSISAVIGTSHPKILGKVTDNFDLSQIEDRRGLKTSWLALNFKGISPIISITKLSTMQSDIRRVETQYLASLLGVKLNKKDTKTLDKLKAVSSKQISDNSKIGNNPNTSLIKESTKKKEIAEVKKKTKKGGKKYHIVKPKETVYRISVKYKISTAKLKKLNHMTNNNLTVGQKLLVE